MNESAQVAKFFEDQYAAARKIEFNPAWVSGDELRCRTFDCAVYGPVAPVLEPGEVVASATPGDDGRKLIIIGTALGNLVVFQHGAPINGQFIVTSCMSSFLRMAFVDDIGAELNMNDIVFLFGNEGFGNVGVLIEAALEFPHSDPNTDRIKKLRAQFKDVQNQTPYH